MSACTSLLDIFATRLRENERKARGARRMTEKHNRVKLIARDRGRVCADSGAYGARRHWQQAPFSASLALDGRIVLLDMDEIKVLVSLLRRTSANVNQIAKRVNSTSRVYENDLAEIQNGSARCGSRWMTCCVSWQRWSRFYSAAFSLRGIFALLSFSAWRQFHAATRSPEPSRARTCWVCS